MSRFAERRNLGSFVGDLWRDRSGATAMEFAIVFPLLAMLIFATLEFGRVLAMRNEMSHALGRAVRVVHLDATTTTEQIVARLQDYLDAESTDLEVSITEISGTNFMEISVQFPFETNVPFVAPQQVQLRVATLAPMVSPTQ